jgi:hypothetical protein
MQDSANVQIDGSSTGYMAHYPAFDRNRMRGLDLLACEVVNQTEGVSYVTSGKIRLILNDLAAVADEPGPSPFYAVHGYFENWSQCRTFFDEQTNIMTMKTDHVRFLVVDLESEMLDVEKRSLLWIRRLNQNVFAETVCHGGSC